MTDRHAFLSHIWLSPLRVALLLVSSFLLPLATDHPVSAQDIPPELKADLLEPWIGDFQGMMERRTIRLLTPYSRSFFFVDGAKQLGREVERGQVLEQMLNRSRKKAIDEIHVLFVPVPPNKLISALQEGLGDIAGGGLTATDRRKQLVDFTAPIEREAREILVTHNSTGVFSSVEALSGKEVFVRESSSYFESLEALNQRLKTAQKPPVHIKMVDAVLDLSGILEMVQAGIFPATVADEHLAEFWGQIFPNIVLHRDVVVREKAHIAWAVRKNSPKLAAVLHDFVNQHGARSVFDGVLTKRYLKNTKLLSNPNASADLKRFEKLFPFFEHYGTQYGLDPLLLAAQGYQESRLRQEARSPVGAIGVMQIMPETGKELRVGKIEQVEPNIHGGAKYMRWIIDQKFSSEDIDSLNRTLFALASYNAGPTRVARLRKEAGAQGFNANLWFNNVERVVARKVGRETVRYVRNIYRYYLAYRIAEQHKNRARVARE
ncbi:MAG: transglycosylase SLT domain-containing protein [Nitrospirales bacterium]